MLRQTRSISDRTSDKTFPRQKLKHQEFVCKCFKESQLKKTLPYIVLIMWRSCFFYQMVLKKILKLSCYEKIDLIFFINHLAAPRSTLGHWWLGSKARLSGSVGIKTGSYDSELTHYPTMPLCEIEISILYLINDFFCLWKIVFLFKVDFSRNVL